MGADRLGHRPREPTGGSAPPKPWPRLPGSELRGNQFLQLAAAQSVVMCFGAGDETRSSGIPHRLSSEAVIFPLSTSPASVAQFRRLIILGYNSLP